jgi:anaerobic selenocysteine-containing dehydrogenase
VHAQLPGHLRHDHAGARRPRDRLPRRPGPSDHPRLAVGRFPTPSGKLELRSSAFAAAGLDPLPDYVPPPEFAARPAGDSRLTLLTGAAHHFTTSSFANVPGHVAREREVPWIEISADDARARGITDGAMVIVSNERGECQLRAVVSGNVLPGVAVSPKGRWQSSSPGGRNINWTTPDALADVGGQSTFHSNLVDVRPA